jgi:bifunctional non-homologous end joining protein LigD
MRRQTVLKASKNIIRINNRELALSNLDKVLYPGIGFTKSQVLKYYSTIAPYIIPHLKGRALTLKRYPNGVEEDYFFEKRCPAHRPEWLETADIPYGARKRLTACLVKPRFHRTSRAAVPRKIPEDTRLSCL